MLTSAAEYVVSPAIHATKIPAGLDPAMAAPLLCGVSSRQSFGSTFANLASRNRNVLIDQENESSSWRLARHTWCRWWLRTYVQHILGSSILNLHFLLILWSGVYKLPSLKELKFLQLTGETRGFDTGDCRKLTDKLFSGEKKRDLCLALGASGFLDYKEVDVVEASKSLTGGYGVHAVICTANGEKAYDQSMQMLRPLGTLVCVGIPNVPFRLPATPFDMIVRGRLIICKAHISFIKLIFMAGLTIVGNSAGTAQEMDELLELAVAGKVKAHIEIFELEDILKVLTKLENAEIEGRAVLQIP